MKKDLKKSKGPIVLGLYSLSAIIGVYTLITIYNSYTYISELVAKKGLVISDQLLSVITYYVNASIPYAFYAIVIWGIGYIIYKLDNLKTYYTNSKDKVSQEYFDIEDDEEDSESL